jgi:PAS domain S-box-containing protein
MIEEVKEAAVFFTDVNGIIETWNGAAEEMKGFTAEDAIGSHLSLLYTDQDKARGWADHNLQEAKKSGFFREEQWRQRKDGPLFWARILLTALRNESGELVGFSKITLDLTEHKLLERCVKEKEETQRVLLAANAGRWTWRPQTGKIDICKNFIALLGHTGDDTSIPFAQWLNFIHPDQRNSVKAEFENSLAGSRGNSENMEMLMCQEDGTYRWFAARADWHQEKDGESTMLQGVNIDIQELKTIGEERRKAIEQLKAEDDNRVFDLFTQAERSSDRSSGGLGLGLALVKNLGELHGGSVAAASEGLGNGSRFTVVLPRVHGQLNDLGESEDGHSLQTASRPLKILVVDDNVDAAAMLCMLLEATDHDVFVEHGAIGALERASRELPGVCLLDIGLPEMDGHELARRLRAQPANAKAVLIAITGYGQENDRRIALAAGFDLHLTKPVDLKKLTAILAQISLSERAATAAETPRRPS